MFPYVNQTMFNIMDKNLRASQKLFILGVVSPKNATEKVKYTNSLKKIAWENRNN